MFPSHNGRWKMVTLHMFAITLPVIYKWSVKCKCFSREPSQYIKPCKHLSKQNMLFAMTFFLHLRSKINHDFIMWQNLQWHLPNFTTVSLQLLHDIVKKLSIHPSRFIFHRLLQCITGILAFYFLTCFFYSWNTAEIIKYHLLNIMDSLKSLEMPYHLFKKARTSVIYLCLEQWSSGFLKMYNSLLGKLIPIVFTFPDCFHPRKVRCGINFYVQTSGVKSQIWIVV